MCQRFLLLEPDLADNMRTTATLGHNGSSLGGRGLHSLHNTVHIPLCWITPVVGTVTEESNDYFATPYWALKKSNDYFATTTDPEKSNDYFAACYCPLKKSNDYFATRYWVLKNSNDYFATLYFPHKKCND
jgi:hypothetical protein